MTPPGDALGALLLSVLSGLCSALPTGDAVTLVFALILEERSP